MNSTVTTLGANYLVHTGYFNNIYRLKVCTIASYRYYSTSKSGGSALHNHLIYLLFLF